jgi:N-methylhydantoinase B
MKYALAELVERALESVAREMCVNLIRTAHSPNIKERADCSTALCDSKGRTLSLATHAPAHLGSTLRVVPAVLDRFPVESLVPGDMFLANDPYTVGVTHLNDCTVVAPVFVDGEVVGFALAIAHQSDVGGRVPGSESGDSNSIFQEGLRIPPIRLFRAGERQTDVWETFLLNSRTPHFNDGDLYAEVAAVNRGIAGLQELSGRYGTEHVQGAFEQIFDATERRIRARIETDLADGEYSVEDWLDDDGATGEPVRIAATLSVAGSSLAIDLTGSDDQLGSGKNVPLTHSLATVYYCLKAMLDPDVSLNHGVFRAVAVTARDGSILSPLPPAGVSSRNLPSMLLADVLLQALGQAAPDRMIAASGPYHGIILSGYDLEAGAYFVDYENFAGGQGAMRRWDGMDAVQVHMTNTANLPIESIESEFPVRIDGYELVAESGGPGRHRGGLGTRRRIRILADNASVAIRSARQRFPAGGLEGGAAGSLGSCRVHQVDGVVVVLPSTVSEHPLAAGDVLEITTPGGGGFGPPLERDPTSVLRDVIEEKCSELTAREAYGVAIDDGDVDPDATRRLRASAARVHG